MPTYLDRYLAGEYEPVWAELQALGVAVREEPLYSDALAVAHETMRRVKRNIEVLVPRLQTAGYEFGHGWAISRKVLTSDEAAELDRSEPVVSSPTDDEQAQIAEIERRAGTLPLSLRAFYEIVGGINFVGSHLNWEAEDLDPLEIIPPSYVLKLDDWMEWTQDKDDKGRSLLPIAPDEHFKYLFGGGGYYGMRVPDSSADAQFEDWHRTTFVGYLRECFRWGCFPGWARMEKRPDDDLRFLTEGLLPI